MNSTPPPTPPTVEALLNSALKKEESARDFYGKLAGKCPVDFVRKLMEKLRDEEEKHVHMIRDMQARMNAGKEP